MKGQEKWPLISTCTAGIKQSNLIDEDRWVCDPFWHVRYLNISLLLAFSPLYIDMPNLSQSMLNLLFTSSMSTTGPVAIKSFSQAGVMANSWAFIIPICHHVLLCIVFGAPLWCVADGILRCPTWGCFRDDHIFSLIWVECRQDQNNRVSQDYWGWSPHPIIMIQWTFYSFWGCIYNCTWSAQKMWQLLIYKCRF